jgi:hypothetical protein
MVGGFFVARSPMPLYDFLCVVCQRTEPDVRVAPGHAVQVDCLDCGQPMVRKLGLPAPAIFESGGTGASKAGHP